MLVMVNVCDEVSVPNSRTPKSFDVGLATTGPARRPASRNLSVEPIVVSGLRTAK